MSEKPNASLSNQDVYEIIQELDNLIKGEISIQNSAPLNSTRFKESVIKETAYMKARNLIFSKI